MHGAPHELGGVVFLEVACEMIAVQIVLDPILCPIILIRAHSHPPGKSPHLALRIEYRRGIDP
jgi:hypothetical protein